MRLMNVFSRKPAQTMPISSLPLAELFFQALEAQNADEAIDMVAENASIAIPPARISGGKADFARFITETVRAFPDLLVNVQNSFVGADGTVVFQVQAEGTQAATWLGVINQEKFLDIRQVWTFGFEGGKIVSVRAFWDQNQVYRRLAVKRIDQVSIV